MTTVGKFKSESTLFLKIVVIGNNSEVWETLTVEEY